MNRLRGVLFDYGHTLVWFPRFREVHLASARNVQRVLHSFGVSIEVSRIRSLIESFIPRTDGTSASVEEEAEAIFSHAHVRNYQQGDLQRITDALWRPYVQNARMRKGVKEILQFLREKDLKMGIVANIWSGGMNPVLRRLDIEQFFQTTVADMDVGFAKPDARIFHLTLDNLGLRQDQVLMVGDNPKTDIKGAHDLGICTVRLMRGVCRTQSNIVKPDFRIRNISSLVSIVQKLIA